MENKIADAQSKNLKCQRKSTDTKKFQKDCAGNRQLKTCIITRNSDAIFDQRSGHLRVGLTLLQPMLRATPTILMAI